MHCTGWIDQNWQAGPGGSEPSEGVAVFQCKGSYGCNPARPISDYRGTRRSAARAGLQAAALVSD